MKEEYKIDFYGEICCDFCNEIIHNHFECPICGHDDAGTSIFGDIEDSENNTFSCEECGTEFETIDGSYLKYRHNTVKVV